MENWIIGIYLEFGTWDLVIVISQEEDIGKAIIDDQGEAVTEIQGAAIQPVSPLRKTPGLLSQIRYVPSLSEKVCLSGRDSRDDQIQLVTKHGGSYVHDRSIGRYVHSNSERI